MFADFLAQICAELDISPVPKLNEQKFVVLKIGNEELELRDLQPGLGLFGKIGLCPEKKREALFLKLMRANYLGQETKDSRIGLSSDEKFLTLTLSMPYEMTYRTFREAIEDFTNFILYWRFDVEKFENEKSLL